MNQDRQPDPRKGEYVTTTPTGRRTIKVCNACKPGFHARARRHTCGLAGLQSMLRIG